MPSSQWLRQGRSKGFTRAGSVWRPRGEDYVGHKIDKTDGDKAVRTLSGRTSITSLWLSSKFVEGWGKGGCSALRDVFVNVMLVKLQAAVSS